MAKDIVRAPEHPGHAWEAQRERFTKLYRDQKKKLVDVQRIMNDQYGFHATERQYKRKIKLWNLAKNSKADEKSRALVTLKSLNAGLELDCEYKLRDGKVPIAASKLKRFARSRGLSAPPIARKAVEHRHQATRAPASVLSKSVAFTANGNKNPEFVNLFELFASVVCFLWFEEWSSGESPSWGRSPASSPTLGFRKWAATILTTTQISTNCILLAMLYVLRLKSYNSTVIGKPGSEFRIAVSALMLANKFLDDNTYTNRTWAEVSGIDVNEVHIMEVEFLSNMRYSLMVHPRDWSAWIKQLEGLQEFLRQPPRMEHVRTIELPEVTPSDKQTECAEMPPVQDDGFRTFTISNSSASNVQNTSDIEMGDTPDSTLDITPSDGQIPPGQSPELSGDVLPGASTSDSDVLELPYPNNQSQIHSFMDVDQFDLTYDTLWPPFPTTLTMELGDITVNPEDAILEYKAIDSCELHEGPIPDLDAFLDPSLWDGWDSTQLDWNPVMLLQDTEIPPEEGNSDTRGDAEDIWRQS